MDFPASDMHIPGGGEFQLLFFLWRVSKSISNMFQCFQKIIKFQRSNSIRPAFGCWIFREKNMCLG